MDKIKVLITGSAGLVGKYAFKHLSKEHEVFGVSRRSGQTVTHHGDITKEEIFEILEKTSPDVIVHCAALTNVDYCQENPGETWMQNVGGTWNLTRWCEKNNKKIIYISTDYVYPGKSNGYDEESETGPVNLYGETKLAAEYLVKNLRDFVILRPTVIYGYDENGNNFLMQMLRLKEKKIVVKDQISNPTDVNVLAECIKKIIEKRIKGIYVATGPETINRYEFVGVIADVFGLDKGLIQMGITSELGQKAKRPMNNGTDSFRLQETLGYKFPSVRESLKNIKRELDERKI